MQILNDSSGPCGWGVVVSPRRILTCTHVVDDALMPAGGDAVWVRFPALEGQPKRQARLTAVRYATLPDHLPESDISVLELADGAMPGDAVTVRICTASFDSSVELFGYALQAGLERGHAIRGRKQDSLVDHRIDFVAELPDLVTRSGASGTPLFIEARGMIGMVVAAQAQQTGFYIPVDVLARFVPELAMPVEPESLPQPGRGRTLSAEQMLRLRLGNNLHRLDRVPQYKEFRSRFAAPRPQTGNSFVCLIAGTADDLPGECRVKIEQEVRQASGARPGSTIRPSAVASPQEEMAPQPLPWPSQRDFDPARALQSLVRSLHPRLSAQKPPFSDAIRSVLDDELSPLLYYSELQASVFGPAHRLLLDQWLGVLDALNHRPLVQPFVHFLMFQFEHGAQRRDGADDQGIEAQLDGLLDGRRGRSILQALFRRPAAEVPAFDARDSFKRLPALGLVARSDTVDWIGAVVAGLKPAPDEASIALVRDAYMQEFDDNRFGVRLKQIERRSRLGKL